MLADGKSYATINVNLAGGREGKVPDLGCRKSGRGVRCDQEDDVGDGRDIWNGEQNW